jgi:hypothetical protein
MGPMKEDKLLSALTAASREGGGMADPRWDRLADGTLTPDEARELAAIAEQSEDGRVAYQAFTPLDEGFRERMTDVLLADLERGDEAASPAREGLQVVRGARGQPAEARKGTEPKRSVARSPWAWVGALAAAAALAMVFGRGGGSGDEGGLPAYSLTATGGEKVTRSDPSAVAEGPLVLEPGSRLELVVSPAIPVRGSIHASTFMQRPGGAPVRWSPPVAISEGGAARIVGTTEQLFPTQEEGEWELVVAVSRQVLSSAEVAGCKDCAVLRRRIRLHGGAR